MFSDSLMLQNVENDAKASGVSDVFMEARIKNKKTAQKDRATSPQPTEKTRIPPSLTPVLFDGVSSVRDRGEGGSRRGATAEPGVDAPPKIIEPLLDPADGLPTISSDELEKSSNEELETVNETVDAITVFTDFMDLSDADEQKKHKNAANAEETKREEDEDENGEDVEGDEDDEDNEESDCVTNVSGKLSGKELKVLRCTAMLSMKFEASKGKGRGHGDDRPLKRNLTLSPTGLENFLELFERTELDQILAPRRLHTLEEVSSDEEPCTSNSKKTTKRPEKTADTQKAERAEKAGVTKKKSQDENSKSVKPAQPASAKETRESSVDRAVRYLMSL
ncbi:hypothetical protein RvY_10311 [Ramazzottius varieornatus]|uniref:Uncharacterized protein n=1 Tax=Ramazzottius varieornatus TaxID=947166 RepID=A0A1D1VET7_RAMVA|nr:hypothetical protein RvY_10311 [Ramazzottius varieornatus]